MKAKNLLSDFQLAFILHIYFLSKNKQNYVKIRPDKNSFPFSLADVHKELSVVFNVLDCYPKDTIIFQGWADINKYKEVSAHSRAKKHLSKKISLDFEENLNILAHNEKFPESINLDVHNYQTNDWAILLYFEDWDINVFPALIKDFLYSYSVKYFELFSSNVTEFVSTEHRRLDASIVKWIWTLEVNPINKGDIDWALTMLIIHWLHDQMYIFDIHPENTFPYVLNFKSRIKYLKDIKNPHIAFKVEWKNVLLNNKIIFDSKVYEDHKIISFIIENQPIVQIWDIYDNLYPEVEIPTKEEKKQLKDKIARMRTKIKKNTWLDMFKSVGLRKVTLNTKVSVILE